MSQFLYIGFIINCDRNELVECVTSTFIGKSEKRLLTQTEIAKIDIYYGTDRVCSYN